MNKVWNSEQIQFLKQNAANYSDAELTQVLNTTFKTDFTMTAVRKQRQRLKISKSGHRGFFQVITADGVI